MKLKKPIYKKVPKEERICNFEYRCVCVWSKDDKYGFVANTICPVHGKQTIKSLKKWVSC